MNVASRPSFKLCRAQPTLPARGPLFHDGVLAIPRRLAPLEDVSPMPSTTQTSRLPSQDARYPDEARRPFLPLALPGNKLAIETYRRNVHVQRLGIEMPTQTENSVLLKHTLVK